MDPLSHAALGASVSESGFDVRRLLAAAFVGAVAAVAPDLDVLVRSSSDPLLYLEYHRTFTHALVIAPIGALVCALACWPFVRRQLTRTHTYVLGLLGYTSHILLDACTTYGTQLLWPFSTSRVSLNLIAFIDPLFAVPLIALAIGACVHRRSSYARWAVAWAIVYLAFGGVQHQRAESTAAVLAASRSHTPERLVVSPALFSLLLWKTIYEHDGRYYVDAVRAVRVATPIPGESVARLDVSRDFPWLLPSGQQARDVERFRQVAGDWIAVDKRTPQRIVDLRYSLVPNEIAGFWAIALRSGAEPHEHVEYVTTRDAAPEQAKRLLKMLFRLTD